MAANPMNARLVTRAGSDWLLRAGTAMAARAGVASAATAWTGWGGLAGLVAPLFVSATGFIVANPIVGALAPQRGRRLGSGRPALAGIGSAAGAWLLLPTPAAADLAEAGVERPA